MATETFNLHNGFIFKEKIIKVSPFLAYNAILGTSKQFKYSEALFDIRCNYIYLKRVVLQCPFCGYCIGAYSHEIEDYRPEKRISRPKAYEWCCIPSLFDEPYKKLELYEPISSTKDLTCPGCSHSAPTTTDSENYILIHNRHKITVSTELANIKEVLGIHWVNNFTITAFPLTESITFNFKKGHIFLTLSEKDRALHIRDITNAEHSITSKVISAIDSNSFFKGALKRYFRKEWKMLLPYKNNELNFKRFCDMTTYINYSKEFYSNTPHKCNKRIRKSLHKYECTPVVFDSSYLPKTKAIKRTMFNNPSYFFYIKELESLYGIFGDLNNLLAFMKNDKAFALLEFMSTYENIFQFYSDFAKIKGQNTFLRYLLEYNEKFNHYGTIYLSLGKKLRKNAQSEWKTGKGNCINKIDSSINDYFYASRAFGYMLQGNIIKFKKMNIDGYMFSALKTKSDYIYCGEELKNCIGARRIKNPIVCMKKNGHIIAAIEVDPYGMCVVQALLRNNDPIEENKTVFVAFEKWYKANNLIYEE